MTDQNKYQEPDKMIRLWAHESERSYGDRLVSSEHLQTYRNQMFDLLKKNFAKFSFNKYYSGAQPENLIFCNFTLGIGMDRYYDQI